MAGHAAVAAEQGAVGVGADDGEGFELRGVERGDSSLVLEESNGLERGLQGKLAVGVAADDPGGHGRIDVGIVEEAELEFPEQHRRDEIVELLFLEGALLHEADEVEVAIRIGQLDVDPGLDGKAAGFFFVLRDEVPVGVGAVGQFPDRVIIGDDEALEFPFLAKDFAQEPFAGVRGHAVDLVVRGHYADGAGLRDHVAERVEERLAQHPFGDVDRGAVLAGFGRAVGGEVLEGGDEARLVLESGVALETLHGGDAEAGVEVGILAVSLLDAAPARVAGDIDDGSERLMGAAGSGFRAQPWRTAPRPARD